MQRPDETPTTDEKKRLHDIFAQTERTRHKKAPSSEKVDESELVIIYNKVYNNMICLRMLNNKPSTNKHNVLFGRIILY